MNNISSEVRNYFKLELLISHSCVQLRQLFKHRYALFNNGQVWSDSPSCGNNYLTTVIKENKKINLRCEQKVLVANGNSDEWDISILITLLLDTNRPKTLTNTQIQQLDQKNQLLQQLRKIRNDLAHHPTISVIDTKFNKLWTDISAILVALGADYAELDKLKDDSIFDSSKELINEDNAKEALRLNSLGKQAYRDEKYSEAIQFYTEGVDLQNIPTSDRATLYSNLAASRLSLFEKQRSSSAGNFEVIDVTDERYCALKDAKQARNLKLIWWKGHYRVGKVYVSLNEHEKAINSFERAFALDPTKAEIRNALDASRYILSRQLRQEHLDPRVKPITFPEHLNEFQKQFGVDPQLIRMGHIFSERIDPSNADVVKGHKYEHGDEDVEQNYEQAAKYFAKAADQGNAEGMYNLARLTDNGLGVKKDHDYALKLLEQAAVQPPQYPLLKGHPNVGVAEAEHALGLRYFEGITVPKNPVIAAHWYQRAVNHNCAQSGNNLGVMYLIGIGVSKDSRKAEQLLQWSARRGDPNAMVTLAYFLLTENDFEMAKFWYDQACTSKNVVAQLNRTEFLRILAESQQWISECSADELKSIHALKNIIDSLEMNKMPTTFSGVKYMFHRRILIEYANRGSITAKVMCNALEHFYRALSILLENETLTEEQENIFVHELAQCYRIEHIVVQFPESGMPKRVDPLIDRVLRRCNKESNSITSQLDEDVRVCYATRQMNSHRLVVQFLGPCKEKYPESVYFFELSGAMNGFMHRLEDALYDFNRGLQIEPNNCELLYHKAVILRQLGEDMNEEINAYRTFLSIAPKDHRKVPEAYYAMGICCFQHAESHKSMDLIKKFYAEGKQAEKLQLPCFLPYKSGSSAYIQSIIDNLGQPLNTETIPIINGKLRLTDLHRIEIIKEHREWQSQRLKIKNNPDFVSFLSTQKPRLQQHAPRSLAGLKPITIKLMDPRLDKVYHGHVLSVTIIEEIHSWTPSIHLVVEDENLGCERLHIYGFREEEGEYLTNEVYTVGSKMDIINPYLRIGAMDHKSLIRVDDISSILMRDESERIRNMCRCCGEPNAPHVCSKCKLARYCSRECQTMDWKVYKHSLICQIK